MGQGHILDANTAALWRLNHGPNGWRQHILDLGPNAFHASASSFTLSGLQRPVGPNKAVVRQTLDAGQTNPPATDHRFTIDSATVAALKTSYTIEAFVYLAQTATTRSILSIGASATTMLINFEISLGGRLRLAWFNGGVVRDHIQSAVSPMTTDTWYHVAIVKDTPNALIYMYINGVLVDTIAKQIEPNGSGTAGYYLSQLGASLGFVGAVKDVTIIPGVKSGVDIAARAALLNTTFELPADPTALLHFRGDEAGDVFLDEVGRDSTNLVGNIPLIMDRLLPEARYAPDLISDEGYAVQFWDGNYANSYLQGDATWGAAVNGLRDVFQSNDGFTFECWINLGDLTPPSQPLRGVFRFGSKFGDPGQSNADMNFLMVSINFDGSLTYWSEYDTDADSIHTSAVGLVPIGDTFHLAIRRNPTDAGVHSVDIFINGVMEETFTGVAPFNNGTSAAYPQMRLGYGTSPAAEHTMYGYIDDVRISNVPRTDAEILESYLRGLEGSGGTITLLNPLPASNSIIDGTRPEARYTPVEFDISNPTQLRFGLWIKFRNDERGHMFYDSASGFLPPFTGVFTASDTNGYDHMVLRQQGGWQDDIEWLGVGGYADTNIIPVRIGDVGSDDPPNAP